MKGIMYAAIAAAMLSSYGYHGVKPKEESQSQHEWMLTHQRHPLSIRDTMNDRFRAGNQGYAEEKSGQSPQAGYGQSRGAAGGTHRYGEARRQQIGERADLRRQCRDTRGTLDSLKSTLNAAKTNDQIAGMKSDLDQASRQLSRLEKQLSSCYRI